MVNRPELPPDEASRPRRHRAAERHAHHYDGSTAIYSIALGFCVFLLIGAMSLRQVSDPGSARKVLSSAVATSTEIDLLLRDHASELRDAARAGIERLELPGYPLDVILTRDEVLTLDDIALRRLILDRSSAILYRDGLAALDETGERSIGTFSSTGLLDLAVGATSESMHDRATIASIVLALLTGLAALGVLVRHEGYARMRSLGLATLVGAGAGLAVTVGMYFLAGNAWSGDPYSDDIADIVRTVVDVPLRNYAITTALGIVIALLSMVFTRLAAREPAAPAAAIGGRGFSRPGDEDREIDAG